MVLFLKNTPYPWDFYLLLTLNISSPLKRLIFVGKFITSNCAPVFGVYGKVPHRRGFTEGDIGRGGYRGT